MSGDLGLTGMWYWLAFGGLVIIGVGVMWLNWWLLGKLLRGEYHR